MRAKSTLYLIGIACQVPAHLLDDEKRCARAIIDYWNKQGWSLSRACDILRISAPTGRKIVRAAGKEIRTTTIYADKQPEAVAA